MNSGFKPMRMSRYRKKKTKKWHDLKILKREFSPGQLVLLYNSRLRLFPGKLKSRWSRPYKVKKVFQHGAVEIENMTNQNSFTVNAQRLKLYHGGEVLTVECQYLDPLN